MTNKNQDKDENLHSLLNRTDQSAAGPKRKRKSVICAAALVCGLCLAAALGVGIWQSGLPGRPVSRPGEGELFQCASPLGIFFLAVFAAVNFLLLVRQHKDVGKSLLDGGNAPGIPAFDYVPDLLWQL